MDFDALHHVNNARYLNYLEEARIDYCQSVFNQLTTIDAFNFVVARVEIDFFSPVRFQEAIKIETRIVKIGTKSFDFESIMYSGKNEFRKVAKARQVIVCIEPVSGRSCAVSDEMRSAILGFEDSID